MYISILFEYLTSDSKDVWIPSVRLQSITTLLSIIFAEIKMCHLGADMRGFSGLAALPFPHYSIGHIWASSIP